MSKRKYVLVNVKRLWKDIPVYIRIETKERKVSESLASTIRSMFARLGLTATIKSGARFKTHPPAGALVGTIEEVLLGIGDLWGNDEGV